MRGTNCLNLVNTAREDGKCQSAREALFSACRECSAKQTRKKWTVLSFFTLLNNRKSLKWKKC
jgi:hypothetical protein